MKEPVRFLKIDVQGGEAAVLRGAKNLIDNNLIDMMLVEFQGEEDVVDFVNSHDFAAFDIEYNAIPVGVTPDQLGFMEGYRELPLSSGSSAIRGRLDAPPRDFDELARFMRAWRPAKGYIWTDMLFVRRGFVDQFHAALDSINVPR